MSLFNYCELNYWVPEFNYIGGGIFCLTNFVKNHGDIIG